MIPGLPPYDADESVWNMSREYRESYVQMKFDACRVADPWRICEIGVYSGISALAFLAACPEAEYVGIDNLSAEQDRGIEVVSTTIDTLKHLRYKASIIIADSRQMEELPQGPYNLVHVDGDHTGHAAYHDVLIAWHALVDGGCLLVDNGHNAEVCASTFTALHHILDKGLMKWTYDSRSVGQIMVWKNL
jgi:hypothetical protein